MSIEWVNTPLTTFSALGGTITADAVAGSPDQIQTFHGFFEVENKTGQVQHDVGLILPDVWVHPVDNPLIALDYDSAQHGWTAQNFNGTGFNLLVTADITAHGHPITEGFLNAATVADGSNLKDAFTSSLDQHA